MMKKQPMREDDGLFLEEQRFLPGRLATALLLGILIGWGLLVASGFVRDLMGPVVVLALLSLRRSRAELGFRIRSFVPATALGLAFVGVLVLVVRHAFASHGGVLDLPIPRGGWWKGTAVEILVIGLALEWWLRGLVFADAVAWQGWKTGVVWSALLGAAAASTRGAEAMVWALCAGVALGLVRARWAQIPALAVAHGAGNVLLGFLITAW